ncbi:MAG: hypothetical protein IIA17_08595 [candidate division Zixibacteria bacterium]|nr:hypothetical protein [candidate division Zixibacteria bacterium]
MLKKLTMTAAAAAMFFGGMVGQALATGTLADTATLISSFPRGLGDGTSQTADVAFSAANDGTNIWTVYGNGSLFRREQDGSIIESFETGLIITSLFSNARGDLFAIAGGGVHSISPTGVATFKFSVNIAGQPGARGGGFNADETELLINIVVTGPGVPPKIGIRRHDATSGAFIAQFELQGQSGDELQFPNIFQMETSSQGRILTIGNISFKAVISEWDLSGNRIGVSTIPGFVGTSLQRFNTGNSFSVARDNLVYLINNDTNQWQTWNIGIVPPAPTLTADIDIKPGSFPNAINLCAGGGVTPLALIGSESFDPNEFGVVEVRVGTTPIDAVGKGKKEVCVIDDVTGDFPDGQQTEANPGGPDGVDDLVCHVPTVDLRESGEIVNS